MAPKRKSTPARNPLHFGASSSSNSAPLSLRFYDDDAHKVFSENFSRWGNHLECQVVLSDFADTDLPSVIHSRGWESLCDVPVTFRLVLIQEFYSNMHGIDHWVPLFFTRVQGTHIPVTLQLVANVLYVPRIKFRDYPSCERLRTVSRDELMSSFCERLTIWGDIFSHNVDLLLKVLDSWTWWLHLFYIIFLIITPSQSLMLDFCYLFLSISL